MKTSTFAKVGVVVGVVACIAYECHRDYYYHKDPPPGFNIVCDGDGHFAPQFSDLKFTIIDSDTPHAWSSRQAAINRAWAQYEYEHDPEEHIHQPAEKYNWHNCNGL